MIVALLTDALLEGPMVIVGEDRVAVYRSVTAYLQAARPTNVATGERVTGPAANQPLEDWVHEVLADVEDVELEVLQDAQSAAVFQVWVYANAPTLLALHHPRVETIKVADGLL